MEFFRHSSNVWGQKMLVGVSWDILWIPFAVAALVMVLHFVRRLVRR